MQRITGLPDEQVLAYEAQAEAATRAALEHVMDVIARRIEASMPVLASVLVAADQGDIIPPGDVPAGDGLPPGQPYVSPDDLASIPPLWQTAVEQQILPIVAQVFLDAAGRTYAGMVEASSIAGLPSVGSLAAERYLAQAQNTFERVGDDLWATARTELSDGFERGESIPQLAERLRASAGVTARTGVLVARTQVNEASNAGSFATAQASGLKMQKEWIATPDLRTRPTHLAADGQRVGLADPFSVGGFSAMFPAAPTLPPAERYNCRCTIGYVMPDRAPAQVRTQDLQDQQLADLPGTSTIDDLAAAQHARLQQIIDEQHAAVEQVVQDVHQAFRDRFGKGVGPGVGDLGPDAVVDPRAIRLAYRQAKTSDELRAAWQDEMRRITSRDIIVQMPPGASVLTMRQYAEGVTQMLERFPEARLRKVSWWSDGTTGDYARIARGSATIEFNAYWAADVHRAEYLRALRHDVSGWTGPEKSGWSVRGASTPQATAYHEFAHILDIETLSDGAKFRALDIATRRAVVRGVGRDELIASDVSAYASSNGNELIAEAMTDVMVNGQRASAASREIYDLIVADYKARGLAVRTTTHVADKLTDGEITAFGNGEIFPKAPAPKMKPVTVARGKDLTGDEELAARAQREAEREHADTGLSPAGFPIKPEAYQGDYAFHEIANAQGFNGLPRIVADDDQWQRLLDEGDYIPLYRGHGWAGGDGVAQVDAFNYGERYVGGGFAPGNNMSPRYETALHYADGHDAAVGHYALRSDAKIVTFPDLVAQRDAYVAKLAPDSIERTLYDGNLGLGRFGAAKGYDAMVVPRGETLLTDRAAEWVIFNRTKIVAYDDSAKGVAAARAGGKAVPAKITAGERARRAKDEAVTAGRSVGHLTRELDQMIAEGGDEAFRSGALWRRIQAKGSELGTPPDVLRALSAVARRDNKGASLEALRAEIDKANLDAGVRRIGAAGDVVRFDARRDQTWGLADDVKIADGDLVIVLRPGSVIEYQGKPLQVAAPRVRPATPQEIAASPTAPTVVAPAAAKNLSNMGVAQLRALAKERGIPIPTGARKADLVKALSEPTAPLDEKALLRAAARERNRLIESSQGTAKLLAEVDELIANKATKAAIRQRLDPALIAPEQVYAGADPAIVDALRKALDTGDPAKLRSALTRAGTKAKLKPVSKAGAKATFDAETMEGVGGIEIAPGAQVAVVRRGTTLTLPDGSTMQLTRAQVTPITPKAPVRAVKARPGPAAMTQARADAWAADSKIPFELQHGTTPESAAAITQSGFDLARLGSKTDFGNLGAGFYFNPAGSISYAEAPGYGASLAVRARVDKVMLTSSREYARGRAVEDYIDIMHSSGEAAARQYLDSKVISSTVEGRFIAPKGMTNRDLIGPISDERVSRYLAIRQDGKVSGFVLREWSIDEGYGAIVWDFPGSVIPGYPVRNGATWFEVNVLKPEDIVVIKPSVPVKRAPRGITEVKLPAGQRGQDVFPVQWSVPERKFITTPGSVTQAQRDAFEPGIRSWMGKKDPDREKSRYFEASINRALHGETPMTPEKQALVDSLDAAIAASRSSRSVTLYRGISDGTHILPEDWQTADLTGLRWTDDGFTAATDHADFAEVYAGLPEHRGFAIRFTLPRGSHGVSMRDPLVNALDDEGEIVMPRGMEFHVIADRGIQGDYGVRWLDVEIRPKKIPIKATKRAPAAVKAPTKAVVRQAAIDEARQVGDLAAEVLELSNNGASVAALRSRITATAKRLGTPDEVRDALLEVTSRTGDVLRAQALQQLERAGITPIEAAGQVVKFDRKIHDPIAGVKAGDLVVVDRPGLTFTRDGEKIQLAKAKVGPAPEMPKPLTAREFNARVKTARTGQEALDAAPIDVYDLRSATESQRDALASYQHVSTDINDALRGGRMDEDIRRAIMSEVRKLEAVLDQSPLRDSVVVYRGLGTGRGTFGDRLAEDLTGFEWQDLAFSSASTERHIARRFTRDGVLMRVLVPSGARAAQLSGIGDEAELLLQRGMRYRVIRDHGVEAQMHPTKHIKERLRIIDVEAIPPDELPPLPTK